jgi:uncharacterized membrane protein
VRLSFQTTPMDLYVVLAFGVLATGFLLGTGYGNPIGLVLVGIVPGYLATAVLLPGKREADGALRLGLTLGLSFSLVAFLGVLLNYTPWGITFATMGYSLLILCLILGTLALSRRLGVPPAERFGVTLALRLAPWKEYTQTERLLTVLLVLVFAVTIPLYGSSLLKPRASAPFTELYLLGPTGNFTGYPTHLNVSQNSTVQIVVANHEGVAGSYVLRVDRVKLASVFNSTTGQNETVVVNRTTAANLTFRLVDGAVWTQVYSVSFPATGRWELQFLLSLQGKSLSPYREVHLFVTVP